MGTDDASGLAIVADAITGVPEPVRTSFFKALSDLLGGLTAVPAAKLKQYAQGIEDTTTARSAVATALAKATAEGSAVDPLVLQAASEIYIPDALRKAKNRISVAMKAAERIAEETDSQSSAAPPDDDWMHSYARFAEDASSDKLQDLFARILAGKIVRPNSFSLSTVRVVAELDQSIAEDFSVVWANSVGEGVDFTPDYNRGVGFSRWKRLAEAGLISPQETAQFLPSFDDTYTGPKLWTPMHHGSTYVVIQFTIGGVDRWVNIGFTRTGRELGSILARPNFEDNMRRAALRLVGPGIDRIDLYSKGNLLENVFHSPASPHPFAQTFP